jgi:hypothetical protein
MQSARSVEKPLSPLWGVGSGEGRIGRVLNVREREENQKKEIPVFFNQCFDKGRLKNFVLWFLLNYGENKTVHLVEQLKNVGFLYASKAGISLGVDDLKIPPKKTELIYEAEKLTSLTVTEYLRGEITGVERFQRLIDTWHRTSEILKQEVINYFEATDILNPVYMMAFSGARGNISQVRQLVGMRGLMADPNGQILDFPIRSNFREGLTLTEYIISSYGARKGIVDTALRTANAGYLTRRLVDVAQHVIISNLDCGTKRGIFLTNMKEGNKTIHSLSQRIVGRILARDLFITNSTTKMQQEEKIKIASRNEEITAELAFKINKNFDKVFVRSSLTCEKPICQLCYGWSLGQGKLVSIGEAVGVVAAQSIGEPGTQLTMRTFHTGGVFSGDISDQIKAPYNGIIEYISAIPGTLVRTPEGKIAFLTKGEGSFIVHKCNTLNEIDQNTEKRKFKTPPYTLLYMRNKQNVIQKQVIAQISNISQKTNATDSATYVLKSEIEGQFYSKSLGFRERMVGPILKKPKKDTDTINPLRNIEYDKIYEAWTWGYAWILSGKIYDFKQPSSLFPIIGDLLNTKSSVSQTKWYLSNTKGNNIFYEFNKRTPTNSNSNTNSFLNTKVKVSTEVLLLDLNNIFFKKFGYTLELSKKQQFISFKNTPASFKHEQTEVKANANGNEKSDLLFFIKTPSISNKNSTFAKVKAGKLDKKYLEKFPYFLQWFPNKYKTKTSGTVIFENPPPFGCFAPSPPERQGGEQDLIENTLFSNKTKIKNTLNFSSSRNVNVNVNVNVKEKENKIMFINTKHNLNLNSIIKVKVKERLNFLRKRQIETYKILWIPSFVFKVSNLLSYSNFIQYFSNSNLNLTGDKLLPFAFLKAKAQKELTTTNNLKLYINLFLNKNTQFLRTNRQGNFMLTSNNFSFLDFNKDKDKDVIKEKNNKVPNTLLKIKKSIIENSNTNINTFIFRKRKNTLTSISISTSTSTSLENHSLSSNFKFFKNSNFTTLKSFCKSIQYFSNVSIKKQVNSSIPNLSLYNFLALSLLTSQPKGRKGVAKQLLEGTLVEEQKLRNTRNKNKEQKNRLLLFVKSINMVNNNFTVSNYLEKNYKQFSLIKDKQKFNSFSLTKINKHINNIFVLPCVLRAKPNILNFTSYTVPLYKSFLVTDTNLDSLSINKESATSAKYHATLKKGWVIATTKTMLQKEKDLIFHIHKKIIYPGQVLLNNICFNSTILAECFLLNSIFNIYNIDSLSIKNLPNFDLNNHNNNGDVHKLHHEKNNIPSITSIPSIRSIPSIPLEDKGREKGLNNSNTKLNWVKNKKSRFYIVEDNDSCSKKKEGQDKHQDQDKSVNILSISNKSNLIGILLQPIKEFEQMSNFDLKKYTYESSGSNSFLKAACIQTSLKLKLKAEEKQKYAFSKSREEEFVTSKDKKKNHFLISLDKYENNKCNILKNKNIFINKSFDSLSKKRLYLYKTEVSNKLNINENGKSIFNTFSFLKAKSFKGSVNVNVVAKKTLNKKPLNLNFVFTKNKDLMQNLSTQPNLFINKNKFKFSDWNMLGLFDHSPFLNGSKSKNYRLKPKYPKEDYTIISNVLLKNCIQQYYDSEITPFSSNLNAGLYMNKGKKGSSLVMFMFSRKPLNLSPFLISYKDLDNFLMSSKKEPFFKLSYLPITNFDSILYPSLSRKIVNIFDFYLSFTNANGNVDNFYIRALNNKNDIFYSSFNNLIKNIFESPCFTFNLHQSLDLYTLKNKTRTSFYPPSPSVYPPLWAYRRSKGNWLRSKGIRDEGETKFFYNSSNSLRMKKEQAKAQTNFYSPFNGELIYTQNMTLSLLKEAENMRVNGNLGLQRAACKQTSPPFGLIGEAKVGEENATIESLPTVPFSYSCMFLTKKNMISYYLPRINNKNFKFRDNLYYKTNKEYEIHDTLVKFLNMSEIQSFQLSNKLPITSSTSTNDLKENMFLNISKTKAGKPYTKASIFRNSKYMQNKGDFKETQKQIAISLLGDFYVIGDPICDSPYFPKQTAVQASGQIIHYNNKKVTLRRGQPILISPKSILHKFDGEFIDPKSPVITLSYQKLKTGDIVQGIPKVEQFFEARTTKRGRLFRDSVPSLLQALFNRYKSKMSQELAVRQSFYKIQQIIVDGVLRVYKSQGVTISDKHLEVIVKQMTSKVRILNGAQTGFFPGEIVDLSFVEKINSFLIKKITYEPLVLGITRASLEVDSFLSAASFQQTTKVLSGAAINRKKDFLKGLKENIILGNLIPAGTGYLVYLDS